MKTGHRIVPWPWIPAALLVAMVLGLAAYFHPLLGAICAGALGFTFVVGRPVDWPKRGE